MSAVENAFQCERNFKIMTIGRITNASWCFAHSLLICAAVTCGSHPAFAQTTEPVSEQTNQASGDPQQSPPNAAVCGPAHFVRCLKDVAQDQAGIWSSPLRIKSRDAFWLVPFAGATAVAIHYDARAQQELGIDRSRIDTSNNISLFGSTYATLVEGSALYAA